MYRDRVHEIRKVAAAPTLEDMRRERKGLPGKLSRLVTYLVNNLFNRNLTATLAWSKAGINDHRLWTAFSDATGLPLAKYIERRRLEVAVRMMRLAPDLDLARISYAVGYDCHGTFVRQYKKWLGKTPVKARRRPRSPELDLLDVWRYLCGELDADAAWRVHEIGVRLYPSLEKRLRERYGQTAVGPQLEINGARIEQLTAEGLWQKLRGLPFEEQKRLIRGVRFHSTVLFDLLLEKSREEGRRDRRRGVEVAELALISLEGSEEIFGERIHDLRALGWAWLGNAQLLALDFPAAEAAFEQADAAWSVQRVHVDQLILARICNLKGKLRMVQRRYDEALVSVARAVSTFRLGPDPQGEARSLLQRASILSYSGKFEASIAALEEAAELLGRDEDHYLAFVVAGNLANVSAKLGRYAAAAEYLAQAENRLDPYTIPLGRHDLEWIGGDIKYGLGQTDIAEGLYLAAHAGFLKAREWSCAGLVSLDLAILSAEKGRWSRVAELSSGAVRIFESLQLYEETLAAVSLLAEAVKAENVKEELLRSVRECIQQDPLARLDQGRGRSNLSDPLST